MRELGVEKVQAYNHDLAWRAGRLLTERWGRGSTRRSRMIGTMITVPLPSAGASRDDAARLRVELLTRERIEIQLHAWRGRLWVRVSAQIYNDLSDVERLAEAVSFGALTRPVRRAGLSPRVGIRPQLTRPIGRKPMRPANAGRLGRSHGS